MLEPVNNFSHGNTCSWQTVIQLVFFAFFNSELAIEETFSRHDETESISITRPRELFMVASLMSGTCESVCNWFVYFQPQFT